MKGTLSRLRYRRGRGMSGPAGPPSRTEGGGLGLCEGPCPVRHRRTNRWRRRRRRRRRGGGGEGPRAPPSFHLTPAPASLVSPAPLQTAVTGWEARAYARTHRSDRTDPTRGPWSPAVELSTRFYRWTLRLALLVLPFSEYSRISYPPPGSSPCY